METLKKLILCSLSRKKPSIVYSFLSLKVRLLYQNIPDDKFLCVNPKAETFKCALISSSYAIFK